eukprot:1143985-Pelagomonas_calceolata.AAC.2
MLQRLACTSCMAREGPLPLQWACPSSKGARLSLPSQGGAVRARGCEVVATVAAEGALHGALVQGGRGGARMGGGGESCCMLLLPAASSARDCSRCTDGGGSKAAPCMLQGAGMLKAWPPCRMGRAPLCVTNTCACKVSARKVWPAVRLPNTAMWLMQNVMQA